MGFVSIIMKLFIPINRHKKSRKIPAFFSTILLVILGAILGR